MKVKDSLWVTFSRGQKKTVLLCLGMMILYMNWFVVQLPFPLMALVFLVVNGLVGMLVMQSVKSVQDSGRDFL